MIKHGWIVVVILLAVIARHVYASEDTGKSLYLMCSSCHGDEGQGNSLLNSPSIAGQHDWYLKRQLQHFAQDIRGNHADDTLGKSMQSFAKMVAEEKTQKTLINYINTLPKASMKSRETGDLKNGSRYYQGKCGACHGGKAQGNIQFNAPRLAGQDPQYLLRQMLNFQRGIRGKHPNDKWGKQMASMAQIVSKDELKDIIFYIAEQTQ